MRADAWPPQVLKNRENGEVLGIHAGQKRQTSVNSVYFAP